MSSPRRVTVAATVGLAIAGLLVVALGLLPGAVGVARADSVSEAQKVALFEDLLVRPGEVWDTVVVIGGDVIIRGTVENVVVVVGGDLSVGSTAVIGQGADRDADSAAVVSVFGEVTIDPGARVSGRITDVAAGFSGTVRSAVVDPVLRPWQVGSPVGWVWTFIVAVVVAVVAVAIAPRQVAAARDRVRHHFFSSLGWGVLGTFIGVPLVSILLVVTIVGILLLVPWLVVVVPLMFLFGAVSVATWIGGAIVRRWNDRRESLLLAAIVGVVIVSIVRFIPGVGALVVFVTGMVGFGATFVAIWDWRRQSGRRKQEEAARRRIAGSAPFTQRPYAPPYAQPYVQRYGPAPAAAPVTPAPQGEAPSEAWAEASSRSPAAPAAPAGRSEGGESGDDSDGREPPLD